MKRVKGYAANELFPEAESERREGVSNPPIHTAALRTITLIPLIMEAGLRSTQSRRAGSFPASSADSHSLLGGQTCGPPALLKPGITWE